MITKQKRLKLKPSARDKRRYFLIAKSKAGQIEDAILEYVGVLGFAKSAYLSIKVKRLSSFVVGSCSRESLEYVRVALGMKGILIVKVSSTLKGLIK
jgi:RNase P/RNase MRP subunit POP5